MTSKTFVFLPDIHAGFETIYDIESCKHITKPTHDLKFFNKVLEFIETFSPSYIILGGDQLDNFGISRFNSKDKIAQVEDSLVRQYETFDHNFLAPLLATGANLVWLQGNHDARIVDLIREKPGLQGLVEPWKYLNLKDLGVALYNRGEVFKLGKLHFTHGDNISYSGDIAKSAAMHYHRNIRFGHFHTYRAYTMFSPTDIRDTKTAIAVPAMTHRAAGWANGKPNTCLQGFSYGEVTSRGNFSDTVVIRTPEGFKIGKDWYHV